MMGRGYRNARNTSVIGTTYNVKIQDVVRLWQFLKTDTKRID